jgi:hypothetical protein
MFGKKGTDGGGGPKDVKRADSLEECPANRSRRVTL